MFRIDKKTCVVLDLDDTLYPEAAYVESGINHVSQLVISLYGQDLLAEMKLWREQGETDFLGRIVQHLRLEMSVKESLLWAYRLHMPCIKLSEDVRTTLCKLQEKSAALAILTDGRSISQRLKLKALGLAHLPAYISEEWAGRSKPDPLRFHQVMQDFLGCTFIYVADNPKKDFLAPNQLGWQTIGVRDAGQNIHTQCKVDPVCHPGLWIDRFSDLEDFIC